MKILSCFIIGEGTLPIQCANILLQSKFDIYGVISADSTLSQWAVSHNLPTYQPTDDLLALLQQRPFDYLFSVVNSYVLPAEVLTLPQRYAINYHDAPLPKYAGMYATSWAIMNQEKVHGVTWHIMTEQIDAGDILKQQLVDVASNETALTLNSKCYEAAIHAFQNLVDDLACDQVKPIRQDLTQRSYFSLYKRPPAGGVVSWQQPAGDIDALVRALTFGDYPNYLGLPKIAVGRKFVILSKLEKAASKSETLPGVISHIDDKTLTITTADHDIVLKELLTIDGQPLSMAKFVERFDLRPGCALGGLDPETASRLTAKYNQICKHEVFWVKRLSRLHPLELPYAARSPIGSLREAEALSSYPLNAVELKSCALSLPGEVTAFLAARNPLQYPLQDDSTQDTKHYTKNYNNFLIAAFITYLARLSDMGITSASHSVGNTFDVGFQPRALVDDLGDTFFAVCLPLTVNIDLESNLAEIQQVIQKEIDTITQHLTFARDIVARYPTLRRIPPLTVVIAEVDDLAQIGNLSGYRFPPHTTLAFVVTPNNTGQWVYNPHILTDGAMARIMSQFMTFLRGVVARPEQPVWKFPLLTAAERRQILFEWNDTQADYPQQPVYRLFEQQVSLSPNHIAVIQEGVKLTYAELNRRSNQLAHYLQTVGVGSETLVGLCVEHSPAMMIGLLGILKAGGAYIPLDPNYPTERLNFMLQDSQAPVILTQQRLLERLRLDWPQVICLDAAEPAISRQSPENPAETITLNNLAYVIYTSGSTGWPKGVAVLHRGLTNYLCWAVTAYEVTKGQGAPVHSSISFDLTITGLLLPLLAGRTVTLLPDNHGSESLSTILRVKGDFSLVKITPAHLDALGQTLPPDKVAGKTHRLVIGGEALRAELLTFWRQNAPDTRLVNEYGPTETVVGCCVYEVPPDGTIDGMVPIGRPIANTQLYILDRHLQPVPVGVPGELYIGGHGVARGYLNRPELTEERFIRFTIYDLRFTTSYPLGIDDLRLTTDDLRFTTSRPLGIDDLRLTTLRPLGIDDLRVTATTPEAEIEAEDSLEANRKSSIVNRKLYKTGDLARYLPDGNLEFLGRIDHQIKIRGYRIEPGEIETILKQHPAVQDVVVIAHENTQTDKHLVAYIAPQQTQPTDNLLNELRASLQAKLPRYMIPARFVFIKAIPLTSNGKVDRQALPDVDIDTYPIGDQDTRTETYLAPRNPIEQRLADMWTQVLGVKEIGVNDSFFKLGGHSLLATQMLSQLRDTFEVEIPLRSLFEAPTIAGLTQHIETFRWITQTAQEMLQGKTDTTPIQPVSRDEPLQLSFGQERLWFLQQMQPESCAYNIPLAACLSGSLDLDALEQSLGQIIRRHESLRTTVDIVDGDTVQIIQPAEDYRLVVVDCARAEAEQWMDEDARRPFDLTRGPLQRIRLFRLAAQEYILYFNFHHIIFDGWSLDRFCYELSTFYQACVRGETVEVLPDLPIQFVDFAAWERNYFAEKGAQGLDYWREKLGGELPSLQLPFDYPRPAAQRFAGAKYEFSLSQTLTDNLKKISQEQNVTLFMTLLAAFKVLLYLYNVSYLGSGGNNGQENILVGAPGANRARREAKELIGFFVNTLILRTDLSGNPTFLELLGRVREVVLEAQMYQDTPFGKLVAELHPERDLNRQPLFQVMFVLQPPAGEFGGSLDLSGLTTTPLQMLKNDTAKFDLTLEMFESKQGLIGSFEYNTDLFSVETIVRMAGHLQILLEGITVNPTQNITSLPLLTAAEQSKILVEWNDTAVDYPRDKYLLHRLFEAQVERTPDNTAVVFPALDSERQSDQQLTYRELNDKSNQLARRLQKLGVGPETLVGIYMTRSLEMVVGLLGVLKAGGAYAPLDPAYPKERLAFMLNDSQTPILLTQARFLETLPEYTAQVICLDTGWPDIATEDTANPAGEVTAGNLAYVIYTSGSTGRPKGAAISHQAICNHMAWLQDVFPLTETDAVLQKTPFSFDASVWEFYAPLLCGARLVMARPDGHKDSHYLVKVITAQKVTVLQLVPSLLGLLLEEPNFRNCRSFKRVFCGGEPLPFEFIRSFYKQFSVELINLYGPTEATIDSTFWRCERKLKQNVVAIGRPISNAQAYILDARQQPAPVGVAGELYIGGDGLARGYLNRPNLTAEKFIPHPFSSQPGARLYKTGDIARYRPDGNIEYIGRIDHQVKLRGFRLELGEIDTLIQQHPAVRQALTLVREDEGQDKRLVTYVIPNPTHSPSPYDLRGFLKQYLPDPMLPAVLMILTEFPLTPNGKIDYKALPSPDSNRPDLSTGYTPPCTELEQVLAGVWANVLGLERVGINDNFFELGGHSLQSVQLASRISAATGRRISVKEIFLHPTIASMQTLLAQAKLLIPDKQPNGSASPVSICPPDSPHLRIERRPLLTLFAAGQLKPVDSVNIGYLPDEALASTDLRPAEFIDRLCDNLPLLTKIIQTEQGRVGLMFLPLFAADLYKDQARLIDLIIEALEISKKLQAKVVSLAGLIPSATDYGRAVAAAIAHRPDLPAISTGHAVTTAAVVLNVVRILRESRRVITQERVGILGLGSVGSASLRLLLKALPHPKEIILCDIYSQANRLEEIRRELITDLKFQGAVRTLKANPGVPAEFYDATLIIGATNAPDVLDIDWVTPGALIVDDSAPHCFNTELAIARLEKQGDILFTEGGMLQSSRPLDHLQYIPPEYKCPLSPPQLKTLFPQFSSKAIMGCVFSGVLSARFENLAPTLGLVDSETSLQHYQTLVQLDFQGADLHCESYVLPL